MVYSRVDDGGHKWHHSSVKVLGVVAVNEPANRVTNFPAGLGVPMIPNSDKEWFASARASGGGEGALLQGPRSSGGLSASLAPLVNLVPPPPDRAGYDWSGVDQALGRALPSDLTILVDVYGDVFFANTLRPCYPTANPYLPAPPPTPPEEMPPYVASSIDLLTSATKFHMLLEAPPSGWPPQLAPAHIDLSPTNTIAWGGDDSGGFYIWQTIGDDPDQWLIILVHASLQPTFTYYGSVSELMVRWLTRELAPPEIPPEWDLDLRRVGSGSADEW